MWYWGWKCKLWRHAGLALGPSSTVSLKYCAGRVLNHLALAALFILHFCLQLNVPALDMLIQRKHCHTYFPRAHVTSTSPLSFSAWMNAKKNFTLSHWANTATTICHKNWDSPVNVEYSECCVSTGWFVTTLAGQIRKASWKKWCLGWFLKLARKRTQGGKEEEVQGTRSSSRINVPFRYLLLIYYYLQHPSGYLLWQRLWVAYQISTLPFSLELMEQLETFTSLPCI